MSNTGKKIGSLTVVAAAVALSLLLCGFNMPQGGRFTAADDVTGTFESYKVNPSYNYYYSGPDAHPIALLGLPKKLKLEPDLWKPVKKPEKQLKELVTGMQSKLRGHNMSPWGFAVEDEKGRRIGIWYSLPQATTIIRMIDRQTAEIYTPPIDTYLKLERERF